MPIKRKKQKVNHNRKLKKKLRRARRVTSNNANVQMNDAFILFTAVVLSFFSFFFFSVRAPAHDSSPSLLTISMHECFVLMF